MTVELVYACPVCATDVTTESDHRPSEEEMRDFIGSHLGPCMTGP